LVKAVVSAVPLTVQKVQTGLVKTGDRVTGSGLYEVPYPADAIDVRPMRGMDEMQNLLSSESTSTPAMRLSRMIAGEALVVSDLEWQVETEPIFSPVYREVRRIMYLLLDLSPSVFGNNGWGLVPDYWMIPVWKGISIALLDRSMNEETIFMMRGFGRTVTDKYVADSAPSAERVRSFLHSASSISDTRIGTALEAAIGDFETEQYDEGYIVILTDGQDNGGFEPQNIREKLKAARLKLHAILLGTENDRLRQTADAYQEIPEVGVVKPLVRN
jgi:uncharacterized protein with von Willebrand factor type A (vWA) domain